MNVKLSYLNHKIVSPLYMSFNIRLKMLYQKDITKGKSI